jgi:hypothetical protein
MSTLRSVVYSSAGKHDEAKDADTQVTSGTLANNSGSYTIKAAATSLLLAVGATTYLAISSAAITASNGAVFTGDGSALTSLNAAQLSSGLIPSARYDFGSASGKPAQGNDSRFNVAPSTAGRIAYDTGSAWAALAAATGPGVLTSDGAGNLTWSATGSIVSGLTLWGSPAVGQIGYQASTANTLALAKADAAATCGNVAGVYQGTANAVTPISDGVPISVLFEATLNSGTPPAAGQDVWLSPNTAGSATNTLPGSGKWALYVGTIKDASTYNNTTGSALPIWPRVGAATARA